MKQIGFICALVSLVNRWTFAQEIPLIPESNPWDTVAVQRFNSASISLERNVNTFDWVGRALIDTSFQGTTVKIRELYTSNIILLNRTSPTLQNLQSNQQNLSLLIGHPIEHGLTSQLQWHSLVYSDNKSVGLGTASSHSVLGGVEYYPIDAVSITPLIGYRWERQVGLSDKGLSYTLLGQTHGVETDGYQLRGSAQFHEDRLNPRKLERDSVHLGAQRLFFGRTRDSLDVGYSRNRREFYVAADGNIESRLENGLSFSNLLDYELDARLTTSIFVNIAGRTLDKDTRRFSTIPDSSIRANTIIDEFLLDTYAQAGYSSDAGALTAVLRLGHAERNEQHSVKPISNATPAQEFEVNRKSKEEQSKDNLTSRTSLSGRFTMAISNSDTIHFSGATSILRYDTPSNQNVEDRDELLMAMSLATSHRVSRYLDVGVSLDGTLSHIVYLLKERSANNNYNRVLRLAPTTTYRPARTLISTNTFEVLANYTVYDFEQQVSSVRSFSYRQFGWLDSSSIDITKRIGLDFFGYLKLYERGQLNWSDFSERMENSFVDKTIAVQARFTPENGVLLALGLRYFSQSRYTFENGTKSLDTYIRSVGPTCLILWDIGRFSRLMFKGWYETRTLRQSQAQSVESSSLPNLSMNINIIL